MKKIDVVIIGGGFYGCEIAIYLKKYFSNIIILEENSDLFQRATYANQARIHNGYHYPRSYLTALRSHLNFNRFIKDFNYCIDDSFEKIYGIARENSKVNASQFKHFMQKIGLPLKPVSQRVERLFNLDLIEELFLTKEVAFDVIKLKKIVESQLEREKIKVKFNTAAKSIAEKSGVLKVTTENEVYSASFVFNCTYSRINTFLKNSQLDLLPFKHEVIEIALVNEPPQLSNLGITVMDGPFFSIMPFPSKKIFSLSHVRYTPIFSWTDLDVFHDPYQFLEKYNPKSRNHFMIKDAQRYLPCIAKVDYLESLFEIKTVLLQNEDDDGRPILFRQDYGGLKNFFVVMGGKIDNIYDILEKIEPIFSESID